MFQEQKGAVHNPNGIVYTSGEDLFPIYCIFILFFPPLKVPLKLRQPCKLGEAESHPGVSCWDFEEKEEQKGGVWKIK